MEEDDPLGSPGAVMALRASSEAQPSTSHADPPSPSSCGPPRVATADAATAPPRPAAAFSAAAAPERRLRFHVELKPGETTIVSWKKLLKGARAGGTRAPGPVPPPPAGAHPALESRIAPPAASASAAAADHKIVDVEPNDLQPAAPSRFSAVIEKIERLYMGKDSSDDEEELADIPDDDQYDTEDSFIDDAELDDYFQVDKSSTKHQGFFVNKGKLERVEPSEPSNLAPKKRARKEPVKLPGEKVVRRVPSELRNTGSVRMKDAARKAPLIGKKSYIPSTASAEDKGHHNEDVKYMKDKPSVHTDIPKNKAEASPVLEYQPSKLPRKDVAQTLDMVGLHKQKLENDNPVEPGSSSKSTREMSMNGQMNVSSLSSIEESGANAIRKGLVKEKNGTVVLPDLNYPGTAFATQTTGNDVQMKMANTMRPKGSALDRAINDLEKSVANCKPSKVVYREGDTSQVVRKRLPVEVKQKLAKVARLANSRGKITSQQFLDRLMGILGHLVQPVTLKRHLKEMVEMGLTVKQAKTDKFQQIKKEVSEMIKVRLNSSMVKDPLNNDLRVASKFGIDEAVEEKICALYDLYVEGMDEDIGPQSRKLYVELAELWPAGYMDAVGIKDVIHRARKRRREAYKQSQVKHEEGIKRPKLSPANKLDAMLKSSSQVRTGPDRLATSSYG